MKPGGLLSAARRRTPGSQGEKLSLTLTEEWVVTEAARFPAKIRQKLTVRARIWRVMSQKISLPRIWRNGAKYRFPTQSGLHIRFLFALNRLARRAFPKRGSQKP